MNNFIFYGVIEIAIIKWWWCDLIAMILQIDDPCFFGFLFVYVYFFSLGVIFLLRLVVTSGPWRYCALTNFKQSSFLFWQCCVIEFTEELFLKFKCNSLSIGILTRTRVQILFIEYSFFLDNYLSVSFLMQCGLQRCNWSSFDSLLHWVKIFTRTNCFVCIYEWKSWRFRIEISILVKRMRLFVRCWHVIGTRPRLLCIFITKSFTLWNKGWNRSLELNLRLRLICSWSRCQRMKFFWFVCFFFPFQASRLIEIIL